jgi:hypothetical protein
MLLGLEFGVSCGFGAGATEMRILSGKFLMKFSSACCFMMLTVAWFKERDEELGRFIAIG